MTTTTYKYHLEKYSRTSKRTCPRCGKSKCFTLYLDSDNRPVGNEYGRCDHAGCGYFLYPTADATPTAAPIVTNQQPPIYYTKDEVKKFRPFEMDNALSRYLAKRFMDVDRLKSVFRDYCVGSTEDGIIFWQIDEQKQIHRGKVMWYNDNGHRLKLTRPDGSEYGKVQMMWKYLNHDRDREPEMCFFGQHLVTLYPDKPIAIVESEKTAIVMSYLYPQYVWLATLSLNNFQAYRLNFLKDTKRRVMVFPDADGTARWMEKTAAISDLTGLKMCANLFAYVFGDGKQDVADIVFEGYFANDYNFPAIFDHYIREYQRRNYENIFTDYLKDHPL